MQWQINGIKEMKDISLIRQSTLESMTNKELIELQRSLKNYIGTEHENTARRINWDILDEWNKRNGFHDYS